MDRGNSPKTLALKCHDSPSPGGPARARNLGASQARGEILLFVDADVTIPPGAIGQVVKVFKREPGIAALFGSYDDEPAESNFLSQYRNLLHHYVHQQGRGGRVHVLGGLRGDPS